MNILNPHDEHKLMAAIPERSAFGARDQAMLTFTLATGLRGAELVGLQVQHVCGLKPEGPGRMVRHRLALPAELAKGGRARTIPLNEPAREALLAILLFNRQRGFSVAAEAPLFPNRQHRAMSTRAVRRIRRRTDNWYESASEATGKFGRKFEETGAASEYCPLQGSIADASHLTIQVTGGAYRVVLLEEFFHEELVRLGGPRAGLAAEELVKGLLIRNEENLGLNAADIKILETTL